MSFQWIARDQPGQGEGQRVHREENNGDLGQSNEQKPDVRVQEVDRP